MCGSVVRRYTADNGCLKPSISHHRDVVITEKIGHPFHERRREQRHITARHVRGVCASR